MCPGGGYKKGQACAGFTGRECKEDYGGGGEIGGTKLEGS